MSDDHRPNVTVIYQDAPKAKNDEGCLMAILYIIGIVIVFGVVMGGLIR